jgi:hypothetical protein
MALPKSMRYLAGATVCIFVYLFVQILKTPSSETPIKIPSKLPNGKLGDWNHDPQLDREYILCVYKGHANGYGQHLASLTSRCDESTATTTHRTTRTARASTPQY